VPDFRRQLADERHPGRSTEAPAPRNRAREGWSRFTVDNVGVATVSRVYGVNRVLIPCPCPAPPAAYPTAGLRCLWPAECRFETQDDLASYRDGVKFDVEARAVFGQGPRTDLQERWTQPIDDATDLIQRAATNHRRRCRGRPADAAPPGPNERGYPDLIRARLRRMPRRSITDGAHKEIVSWRTLPVLVAKVGS